MTKIAKARRRRAERRELEELRSFKQRAQCGGISAQQWEVNTDDHARMDMAARLGCTLVLRNTDGRRWRVYAVKN